MKHRLARLRRVLPLGWPITVKVPLVVAGLMFIVSGLLTERVLSRLEATQETHLRQLTGAYMDGLSTATLPHVLRHDVWEVFDALDRASRRYKGLDVVWTTIATPAGSVIASSQPRMFPADARLPASLLRLFADGSDLTIDEPGNRAHARRVLMYQGRTIGAVYADVDISGLLAERDDVFLTLLSTNALLTLGLAAIGYLAVRRMVRPVTVLAAYLERGSVGAIEPMPMALMPSPESEFGRLFSRYNDLAGAVRDRERLAAQLADEEKLASLGRLASGMAHEINNPLGGMFNAIDALEWHGDSDQVRRTSVGLLKRGLRGIRDVVRAALQTYRRPDEVREMRPHDLDDLRLLIAPELRRRSLRLSWDNAISEPVTLGVTGLRQTLLNLLLNACAATPAGGEIEFFARSTPGWLDVTVSDDGPGLADAMRDYLEQTGAGAAPIADEAGLGLWMVRRWADETGARIVCRESSRDGARIEITLPLLAEGLRDAA